jgi:transposase
MRKIRDVLRLTAAGMSSRNIALSLSIGATTVIDFLQRARSASMSWPLPEDMTDEALEIRLPRRRWPRSRRAGRSPIGGRFIASCAERA